MSRRREGRAAGATPIAGAIAGILFAAFRGGGGAGRRGTTGRADEVARLDERRRSGALALMAHDLPRHAAALTYYLVLAVFPILIVVTALLGLVGLTPAALQTLLDAVAQLGSQWAVEFVSGVLDSVLTGSGTPLLLSAGVLLALWTTSGYVAAFMWAAGRDRRRARDAALVERPRAAPRARAPARRPALPGRAVVVLATPFAQWLGDLWASTKRRSGLDDGRLAVLLRLRRGRLPAALPRRAAQPPAALRDDLVGACFGVAIWLSPPRLQLLPGELRLV